MNKLHPAYLFAILATVQSAHAANTFDGTWSTIFICPATPDGTKGYARNMLAQVRNGVLHAEIGIQGQAGYLALDGAIQPNGNAILTGQGLTSSPDYAVGRPSPTTPYKFQLQSRFTPTQGTGNRVETRRCNVTFTRN